MSVLIKGMEIPTSCYDCRFHEVYSYKDGKKRVCELNWEVLFGDEWGKNFKHPDCPLIEVPKHGDLIDRDAFLAEQRHLYCENCERRKGMKNGKMKFVYDIGDAPCRACGYGDVLDDLEDAPTIIPADPAEEGEG